METIKQIFTSITAKWNATSAATKITVLTCVAATALLALWLA